MKKILLSLSVLICAVYASVTAQQATVNRCSTTEHTEWLKSQDPTLEARMASVEEQMDKWIAEHGNDFAARTSSTTIIIPTVVHVVWFNSVQNISDDMVKSQMDVLNEDFGGYNSDAVKIPPFFRERKAGDMGIRFQLAVRDPNGNVTNGIHRVQTTNSVGFSQNDGVKHASSQGADAWPCGDYMNIWVCNFSAASGLLGYAQFPGGSCATDGVVIQYDAFGRISPYPGNTYSYGRTTTHEFSHCFNLRHIWGDATCGNDFCTDTPVQTAPNFGAYNCHTFTCNNQPTGDMYMNYMDYTDDRYLYMFTANQAARVLACINTSRVSLLSSLGCTPVNQPADDASISEIVSPGGVPCDNTTVTFIPEVTLKNFGTATLTSVTINYKIDNGAAMTQAWSGSLASGTTTNVQLPSMSSITGDHLFYAWTSLPNGNADGTPANDRSQRNFIGHAANTPYPITQGFDGTFPPTSWSNKNFDCGTGWVKSTTAFHSGTGSAFFNNYVATSIQNGVMDELITQPIDMSSAPSNAVLTFWKAYAPKSLTGFDTLDVLVSTDCGYNFTSIHKEWALLLATSPANNTSPFVPTTSDWAQVTVSLASYTGVNNLIIAFRNINHGGNNLYLDDINVTVTGVNEIVPGVTLNVYPNPTEGLLNISTVFENPESMQIFVTDMLGQVVYKTVPKTTIGGLTTIDLSKASKGIYFVELRTPKGSVVKKISLNN
jgi:hypothetical protein